MRRDGPRVVGVGTCILQQQTAVSPEDLLASELAMVDRMATSADQQGVRLDLAILPEVSFKFASADLGGKAETLTGPRVDAFADKARQYSTYVTVPMQLRRDDGIYNSIVLLDRTGEPAGVYDKVHPVMQADGSLEFGIDPGKSFPVFDVDFGRVGVQICWDIAFPDGWQALANQDTELVLFPTNPASPMALRGYAWQHGYYIAAASVHPPGVVVDPLGRVIADLSQDREVAVIQIDLDFRVLHSNCMWDYTAREHPEYEGRICLEWDPEAHQYLATSVDSTLPIRDFLEKEKLLTGRQRIRRNKQLLGEARGGPPAMPTSIERE